MPKEYFFVSSLELKNVGQRRRQISDIPINHTEIFQNSTYSRNSNFPDTLQIFKIKNFQIFHKFQRFRLTQEFSNCRNFHKFQEFQFFRHPSNLQNSKFPRIPQFPEIPIIPRIFKISKIPQIPGIPMFPKPFKSWEFKISTYSTISRDSNYPKKFRIVQNSASSGNSRNSNIVLMFRIQHFHIFNKLQRFHILDTFQNLKFVKIQEFQFFQHPRLFRIKISTYSTNSRDFQNP